MFPPFRNAVCTLCGSPGEKLFVHGTIAVASAQGKSVPSWEDQQSGLTSADVESSGNFVSFESSVTANEMPRFVPRAVLQTRKKLNITGNGYQAHPKGRRSVALCSFTRASARIPLRRTFSFFQEGLRTTIKRNVFPTIFSLFGLCYHCRCCVYSAPPSKRRPKRHFYGGCSRKPMRL